MKDVLKMIFILASLGLFVSFSIYWLRLGDGVSRFEQTSKEMTFVEAQKRMGALYELGAKCYYIDEYQVTRRRWIFPMYEDVYVKINKDPKIYCKHY